MDKLGKQLLEISEKIHAHSAINERISKASVGWHIEHTLLSINRIIMSLQKSDPSEYRWEFKLNRLIIFSLKTIPRGKAKSPRAVLPENFSHESLKAHLQKTQQNVRLMEEIAANKFFVHPYFGSLNLKNAKKFIEIHTNHHLKIIHDIIQSKKL